MKILGVKITKITDINYYFTVTVSESVVPFLSKIVDYEMYREKNSIVNRFLSTGKQAIDVQGIEFNNALNAWIDKTKL